MSIRVTHLMRASAILAVLALASATAFGANSLEEGIQELSRGIVPSAQRLGQKRVAVVDFSDLQGRVTILGRFIAEEMSAALVLSGGGIRVVDRLHLARIIQEQKLAIQGITDPQAVKRLGQLAGADALIVGSITDLGEQVRITAKVLSTSTADIVGAAQTTVPKSGTVARLMGAGAADAPRPSPPRTPGAPTPPPPRVTLLSQLPPVFGSPNFERVTLFGQAYETGFYRGIDAPDRIIFNLNRQYARFEAVVGVADNRAREDLATFKVLGDGEALFSSQEQRSGDVPARISLSVRGILRLELVTLPGTYGARVVWADLKLIRE